MLFCPHCEILLPPDAPPCPACGAAAPALAPAWMAALPAPPSLAPVAFAGGVLLTGGSPEPPTALEWRTLADGQPRWQYTFDHALITGLVVLGDHLLLSLTSTDPLHGQGALVVLDTAGNEVWRWTTEIQQISAPAIAGDAVYVTAGAGHLVAVDITTGAEQGRWALPVSISQAAPAVAGETLYLPCRGPHLLAVTLSGALCWRFDAPLPENAWLHHTPVLCQDTVFAASSTGVVLALQVDSGTLRWQLLVGPPDRPLSPPITDGERLYVGARDGLHTLTLDGQPLWHSPTTQKITAAPVVVGGVVYAACWDRTLYALDAVTGRELWRYPVERHIEVSPLIFSTEGISSAESAPSVEAGQAYAVITDAGGTLTALIRPRSAVEHEATGQWQEAACAYAALDQPARGAALLEAHDLPYQAAQLWEIAGEPERAAIQYEATGHWEQAAALWAKLDQPLRQTEALQHHARALSTAETPLENQAALWEQIAALYADHDQPTLAEHCRREVDRCRRQPVIALTIEHGGLVVGEWSLVRFIVHNAGFGPARNLVIHTDKQSFAGQVMQTQRITTLEAGAQEVRTLDLKPLEAGSVPLRVTVEFTDHAGQPLACEQTIHLPVARQATAHTMSTHTQVFRAAPRFVDLEIRIFKRAEAGYPVEITLAGQQHFAGVITEDLANWIASSDPDVDGRRLFAALTTDPALANAWARCHGQAPQRRVRLWLDVTAPELHSIPWECLCADALPLAADAATPFSRYLPTQDEWGALVTTRPVRILAAIANPADLAEYNLTALDVEQEQALLAAALRSVGGFQVDFLPAPVTLARLEKHLRGGCHLLHFVGHGVYNARKQETALCLQDDAGETHLVSDMEFGAMLARQGIRPNLVVLAACHGATRSTADAWRGMAPALVQAGVPAVVAMQGAVAIVTAQAFTAAFYSALSRHGAVDLALNQARSLLISQGCSDVALPVLLMRLQDGQVV